MAEDIKDFYRGDSLSYKIVIQDKLKNPIDITGYKVLLTMKSNPTDPDEEAEINETVTSHIDPKNGTTVIKVPKEITEKIKYKTKLYYKVKIIFNDNTAKTLHKSEVWAL